MAENDILLSVGIDLSSLKNAQAQVAQAVAGWNIPQPQLISKNQSGLVDQYGKSLKAVTSVSKETAEAVGGLGGEFGKLFGRVSVWALAWTVMYSTLRTGIKEIQNIGDNLAALSDSLNSVRAASGKTAEAFDKDFAAIKNSIIDTAKDGIISVKDLAAAYKVLNFEGLNTATSLTALENVKQLSTVTGEKAVKVAESLAEVYGLFGDTIKGAGSEQEKLTRVANLMASAYVQGNISVNQFHSTISKVGISAKALGVDLNYLAKLMILLDSSMFSNKQAATFMKESLLGIMSDTAKLNSTFGTTINELDNYYSRIIQIQKTQKQMSSQEFLQRALKIYPDINQASEFVNLLKQEATLKGVSAIKSAELLELAKQEAHQVAAGFNDMRASATGFFSWLGEKWKGFSDAESLKTLEKAKRIFETPPEKLSMPERDLRNNVGGKNYERDSLLLVYEKYKAQELFNQKLVEAAAIEEKQNADTATALAEALRQRKEFLWQTVKINEEGRIGLAQLERESNISLMQAGGAEEVAIARQRINDLILSSTEGIVNAEDRAKAQNELRLAATRDTATAYQMATAALGTQAQALTFINGLEKERLAINQQLSKEVMQLADDLQSKTTDYVKNLMSGTGNIKEFLNGISESFRETFANNLVQMFGEKSGVFASMASSFMSPIHKATYNGIQSAVPSIIKAHVDGIAQGMANAQGGKIGVGYNGVAPSGAPQSQISQFMNTISGKTPTQFADVGNMGKVPVKPTGMQSFMSSAGSALGMAGGVLSGVQGIMSQKGAGSFSGGMGGALAGAQMGALLGPIGMIGGALLGGVLGGILGNKKNKAPEPVVKQELLNVRSVLQLSYKEHQLTNRNLEGIRKGQEGYIFSKSSYFQEKSASDDFNADKNRGYIG